MNEDLEVTLVLGGILGIIIIALMGVNAVTNLLWEEGYEVTIQGTVQIAKQEENRFWSYKYTHIELQSFSGEDYDLSVLGHHDFVSGLTYKITYERVSPCGRHQNLYGRIVSVEEIEQ